MKKTILVLLAMLPIALFAQDYHSFYNQISKYPTPAEVASEKTNDKFADLYENTKEQLDVRAQQAADKAAAAQKAQAAEAQALAGKQSKTTGKQKQAQQAMAGDMMQIIQELGIPMEQLAQMSDDELEALVMAKVAPKAGMSQAEMEKLSKMSDKEAEAYLRSHPELMESYMNSEYGKYAGNMGGAGYSNDDAKENELLLKMMEVQTQLVDLNKAFISNKNNQLVSISPEYAEAMKEKISAPYMERYNAIYAECWNRIYSENLPKDKNGNCKTPAYAKEYYDRMNAVLAEANVAIATEWCKMYEQNRQAYEAEINKVFPLCDELAKLYSQISTPAVKQKALAMRSDATAYNAVYTYIIVLQHRLEAPLHSMVEMPTTFDPEEGQGGKG